jgi:hypothetical protein
MCSLGLGSRRKIHPAKCIRHISWRKVTSDYTYCVLKLATIGVVLRIRRERIVPFHSIGFVLTAVQICAVKHRISKAFAFPRHVHTSRYRGLSSRLGKLCRAGDGRYAEGRT